MGVRRVVWLGETPGGWWPLTNKRRNLPYPAMSRTAVTRNTQSQNSSLCCPTCLSGLFLIVLRDAHCLRRMHELIRAKSHHDIRQSRLDSQKSALQIHRHTRSIFDCTSTGLCVLMEYGGRADEYRFAVLPATT